MSRHRDILKKYSGAIERGVDFGKNLELVPVA